MEIRDWIDASRSQDDQRGWHEFTHTCLLFRYVIEKVLIIEQELQGNKYT